MGRRLRVAGLVAGLGLVLAAALGVLAPASAGLHERGVASLERMLAGVRLERRMPGPRHAAVASGRLDRNDECVVCHADIAAEWQGSLHRQAYVDPMFQAALAHEEDDLRFCRGCHAPEADPRSEPSDRAAAVGVACVTCHVLGSSDAVLAAPRAGADDSKVPHPLQREAAFGREDACARCHEFPFPSGGRGGEQLEMQRTIAEHRRSLFADEACQSCHMIPRHRAGSRVHRGHDFTVVGEPLMLRAAVSAQASRPTREQVVIELRPRLVGHAFPTGDLYRRLIVRVASEDGAWSEQRSLARHFGPRRVAGHVILSERSDDRVGVGAGSRIVEIEVPAELRERALVWSLTYERVLEGGGTQAQVWDRSTVLEGRLEPRATSEQSERASTITE